MTTASYHDIVGQAATLDATVAAAAAADLGAVGADRPWIFTGCGASYHAGTAAAGLFSALSGHCALSLPASDLWMNPDVWLRPGSVVVGLSRTGTTTETVAALAASRALGATTIGVSLSPGTPLVEQADHAVVLDHVGERGRVMTRSFTNLLLASQTLVVQATQQAGARDPSLTDAYRKGLAEVPGAVAEGLPDYDDAARVLAKAGNGHLVFLGSGPDLGLCRQAALQTQETARAGVEAHGVLDYRHGPLATLTPDSLLVLLTGERSLPADLVLADDVAVLGGSLIAVGPAPVLEHFPDHVEKVSTPKVTARWLQGDAGLPFLQLLAYHLTLARDADPESVANLDRTKTPHVNPHVLAGDLFASARS